MAIAQDVREMAAKINGPSDMWEIHDYLTEKREETDQKYNYRYSVLLFVFARLMYEGWIKEEDLEGLWRQVARNSPDYGILGRSLRRRSWVIESEL